MRHDSIGSCINPTFLLRGSTTVDVPHSYDIQTQKNLDVIMVSAIHLISDIDTRSAVPLQNILRNII